MKTRYFVAGHAWMVVTTVTTVTANIAVTVVTVVATLRAAVPITQLIFVTKPFQIPTDPTLRRCSTRLQI